MWAQRPQVVLGRTEYRYLKHDYHVTVFLDQELISYRNSSFSCSSS